MSRHPRQPSEPTFEDYVTARRVIIHVRELMAESGKDFSLLGDPFFAEIVMRSSRICNPELWNQSQLASAEGNYGMVPVSDNVYVRQGNPTKECRGPNKKSGAGNTPKRVRRRTILEVING